MARWLKDGYLDSPRVNSLSDAAEVLFMRLILICDGNGRYYADLNTLRSALFPLPSGKVFDRRKLARAIAELHAAELLDIYTVAGINYIQIRNATVNHRRRKLFPSPSFGHSIKPDDLLSRLTVSYQFSENWVVKDKVAVSCKIARDVQNCTTHPEPVKGKQAVSCKIARPSQDSLEKQKISENVLTENHDSECQAETDDFMQNCTANPKKPKENRRFQDNVLINVSNDVSKSSQNAEVSEKNTTSSCKIARDERLSLDRKDDDACLLNDAESGQGKRETSKSSNSETLKHDRVLGSNNVKWGRKRGYSPKINKYINPGMSRSDGIEGKKEESVSSGRSTQGMKGNSGENGNPSSTDGLISGEIKQILTIFRKFVEARPVLSSITPELAVRLYQHFPGADFEQCLEETAAILEADTSGRMNAYLVLRREMSAADRDVQRRGNKSVGERSTWELVEILRVAEKRLEELSQYTSAPDPKLKEREPDVYGRQKKGYDERRRLQEQVSRIRKELLRRGDTR